MVICDVNQRGRRRIAGLAMVELIVAMGVFMTIMIPLGYSYSRHQELLRDCYYRAVVMEILDGGMEVLVAGEWRAYQPGTNDYPVKARSAANLPPGAFKLVLDEHRIRMEWRPLNESRYHSMHREAIIP